MTLLWTVEAHSKGYQLKSAKHEAFVSYRRFSLSLQSLSCQNGFFSSKKHSADGTMEAGYLQSPVAMPTLACQKSFCNWAAGIFHIRCLTKCTLSEIGIIIYIQEKHKVLSRSALFSLLLLLLKYNVLYI